MYVEVDCMRGGSGSPVKHIFQNGQGTRIVGDVTNDRKVDMRDIGRITKNFGKVCDYNYSIPEYYNWEYFYEDVYADAKIDSKDYGYAVRRFGQEWS